MYICTSMYIHIPFIYMHIYIYGYGDLTSSILSEYPSEQIRPPTPPHILRFIGITRVGSSEADPTKKIHLSSNNIFFLINKILF